MVEHAAKLCSLQNILYSEDSSPSDHPACHPAPPASPPCLPSQAVLPTSSATTASLALRRASAVLVLLQRLCVWGASQRAIPSNILHTQSNILRTSCKILCTPSKILCTPSNILHKSYLRRSEHPICMALAPGCSELWSWTPPPCHSVKTRRCEDKEGYIECFGGM